MNNEDQTVTPTIGDWLLSTDTAATAVVDRLADLAPGGLAGSLQKIFDEYFNMKYGSESATLTGNIRDKLSLKQWRQDHVSVRLTQVGDRLSLKSHCSRCIGYGDCNHGFGLTVSAVRAVRKDVADILDKPEEVEKRTLSSDAIEFIKKAASVKVKKVKAEAEPEKKGRLLYRLVKDRRGFYSKLAVHISTLLKSGKYSTRVPQVVWSHLMQLTQANQGVREKRSPSYINYERTSESLLGIANELDNRAAKEIYLKVGLPTTGEIDIGSHDLIDPLELICRDGRLFGTGEFTQELKLGAPKAGAMGWKRDDRRGWCLTLLEEGEMAVIPCMPPMYFDESKSEIGRIEIEIEPQQLELIALGKSLSDSDIQLIRKHANAERWMTNLPALPNVVVEYKGTIQPSVHVKLDWRDNAVRDEYFSVTKRKLDSGEAIAVLDFFYGDLQPRNDYSNELIRVDGDRSFVFERDISFEEKARELLKFNSRSVDDDKTTFIIHRGSWKTASKQHLLIDFHENVVQQMRHMGWNVVMGEGWPLKHVELDTLTFTSSELEDGWFGFDISTNIHGAQIDMLALLMGALNNKGLIAAIGRAKDDESFKVLSPEGYAISVPVTRLKRLLPFFLTLTTDKESGKAKLRRIDFGVLEEARGAANNVMDGSLDLLKVSEQLSNFSPSLPPATLAKLAEPAREYQAYGAAWIDARRKLGFGAIIGDEYAVGKTLQTALTVFNAAHEEDIDTTCCLIVVTKTLFFSRRWQDDIERFLPTMRIAEVYGSKQIGKLESLDGLHAVLTTYETVIDKLDVFQEIKWNLIACDEGHKVNNSATFAHKAIAALNARQKLIVTGSPMQNGAREIWALMNLVAPGLLKDRTWFNQTFPKAKLLNGDLDVVENSDEAQLANVARLHALGKIISPFFLRRTNNDLGRQLPAVQVIERHVVMEQDQADVYEAFRAAGKREALEAVAAKGLSLSRIDVLTQINRLRQICCDPNIVTLQGKRSLKTSSAKRDAVLEICRELVGDNQKIVITSEWNKLLENINQDLQNEGIETVSLTGKLSGSKRTLAQDSFRTGNASVMLIQLTLAEGIELPEGDAIIICEPWWNRKKEEQAIARLRRDERNKHINVIRLVVQGSVEMGVIRVAQGKLDDIESVQMGQAAATGGLSMDDIDEFFRPLEKSAVVEN